MKCERCGYISFEHNMACPSCGSDLSETRSKLGITYEHPEANFDELFMVAPAWEETAPTTHDDDLDIDLGELDDGFEFTLDD